MVLTKMKLFSNSQKNLLISEDSLSVSSVFDPENPDQNQPKSSENLSQKTPPVCDYLAAILCNAPLSTMYKFESEDSGVELPSGANSPSTPIGSEKSFTVHSRKTSCDSGDLKPDRNEQEPEPTEGNTVKGLDEEVQVDLGESEVKVDLETEEDEEVCEETLRERVCEAESRTQSLEDYMDECCRLSQVRSVSSGLSYLEQVCRLMERLSCLQETSQRLQRQLCSLRTARRLDQDRLDFLLQQCSCGAADLVFAEVQESPSRTESLNGTLSDLRTIPETMQRVYASRDGESGSWRRRSFTETEALFNSCSRDRLLQRRLSDRCSSSWGRVRDLVKRTRLRSQSRLLQSSFKNSCPQLYRPDLGPVEASVQNPNRNSMVVLGPRPDWTLPGFKG